MNVTRKQRSAWAAAMLVAAGSAFGQDPPRPAPDVFISPQSASPAVALTPMARSSYVPPPAPVEPEPAAPARLIAPAIPAPASAELITPVVHKQQKSLKSMNLPTWPSAPGTGPAWRWYGWGAAQPHGMDGMPIVTTAPASNPAPAGTETPTSDQFKPMPPAGPTMPPAGEVRADGNWVPAPTAGVAPAAIGPPTADLNIGPLPPKPVAAPPIAPPVDPWTSVTPQGAKAQTPTPIARASSAR